AGEFVVSRTNGSWHRPLQHAGGLAVQGTVGSTCVRTQPGGDRPSSRDPPNGVRVDRWQAASGRSRTRDFSHRSKGSDQISRPREGCATVSCRGGAPAIRSPTRSVVAAAFATVGRGGAYPAGQYA